PTADNGIQRSALRVRQTLAGSERHLPDTRNIDELADVEVRVPVVVALTDRIDDERAVAGVVAESAGFRVQAGGVVQRVGKRGVEIQGQGAEPLLYGDSETMVIGVSNRAPG